MAGIFSPTLQQDVTPIRATEQPSAAASLFNLAGTVAEGLGAARDRATREAKANAPSYTERKDQFEKEQLNTYTTTLQEIQQMKDSGDISDTLYRQKIKALDLKTALTNVDITSPSFDYVRMTVTGQSGDTVSLSEDEILLDQMRQTQQGQVELAFARISLAEEGFDPTDPSNIAFKVRERSTRELAINSIKVTDELSWRKAKGVFLDRVNMFQEDTQAAVNSLTKAGVPLSAEMIQNQYLSFTDLKTNLLARIPANIPSEEKTDLDKSLGRIDDFFKQIGMVSEGGLIKLQTKDELQVTNKINTWISILNQSENGADHILAAQIMAPGYKMDDVSALLLQNRFNDLGSNTPVLPEWVSDANIIVSNNLMATYNNLVEFEMSGGVNTLDKTKFGALSLVNPDEAAKWSGLTNAQGWIASKAYGQATKGFSKEAILAGNMTDGFFNTIAGLALSFESIDINEEPVSFNGVRKEISTSLPELINTAKAIDPVKGGGIQALMFRSLSTQKAQYDMRIQSDEGSMGLTFDTKKRVYNVMSNTSDPQKLMLRRIIDEKYSGDASKAYSDMFRSVTFEDLASSGMDVAQLKDQTPEGIAQSIFFRLLPPEKDFKALLDLRDSSVYLSRIASQIEPEGVAQLREEVTTAQQEALSSTSSTAALIDRFESGTGGYSALFNQAQDRGAPFAGIDVAQKTLGELYAFSDPSGAYGQYVKQVNPEGVVATPMGRYQFVGTTLKNVANRMGLPDSTVFNGDTQDAMFLFLARDVISGKRQASKRDALRGTWAGLKGASDAELDIMINEIESGNPNLGAPPIPTITQTTLPAINEAPATATPVAAPTPTITPAPTEQTTATQEAAPTRTYDTVQPDQGILDTINTLGADPADVKVFDTEAELKDAATRGEVSLMDLVVVNGRLMSVTRKMIGQQ